MLISLSAKAKVTDFQWYTFEGTRRVLIENANRYYDLEITKGEHFGLKLGRTHFWLAQVEEESGDVIKFKLEPKEARRIVEKSKGFSGKIGKIKVQPGTHGKERKASGKPSGTAPVSSAPTPGGVPRENKVLTKAVNKIKFPGAAKITHVMTQRAIEGEIYHYYDISDTLPGYRRKHKLNVRETGDWAKDIEASAEKAIKKIDAEIGTVRWKGKLIRVMAILELE